MNIAIVKVLIQGFVNDRIQIDFVAGDWERNFDLVYKEAESDKNEEIIECMDYVKKVNMAEHMFGGE